MTIESVTEMWSRRGGARTATNNGANARINFRAAYQVAHTADATIPEILDAIPKQLLSQYGTEFAFADQIGELEAVSPILSIVPVSYSGEVTANNLDDPLANPPVISWTNSSTNEPVDTDAFGMPFVNTAGDVVDGFAKDVSDQTLTVVRNFASVNTFLVNQYLDSVNTDTFADWPPGTAALRQYTADFVSTYAGGYWSVTARIDFRIPYLVPAYKAWWARYRSQGLNYIENPVTVTLSGGGFTEAAEAYAIVRGGAVTGVVVAKPGQGYTSAPTVAFSSAVGTGATATASLTGSGASRRVASISVGAGGSGYTARKIRITDDNKEPISTPVLLNRQGGIEFNPNNAVFLERPLKQYVLPYNFLGLL